jgi:hypothetical protein
MDDGQFSVEKVATLHALSSAPLTPKIITA